MSIGIAIQGLSKSFGDAHAVDDLSLEIAEGEMVVLLGPSGCGKTTTMRCIAGLERPDAGQISIGGRPVFDAATGLNVPVNQRHVGMVFQSYAIWPHLTVFENVAFPLQMAKVNRADIVKRVNDMLSTVGLSGLSERGASYLSGGQMQRVALARSLVMQPAVLLFDEPLSNLDARLRDHLRIELRELQTEFKITSVYVTHDQREALALADRIVVMDAGKVLQVGTPIDLYQNPRTRRIAEFLGYTNIFLVQSTTPAGDHVVALLPDGEKLSVTRGGSSGSELAVCVRPEDVLIRRGASDGAASTNALVGQVTLASFMGTHMQYRVRLRSGAVWEAISPTISTDILRGTEVTIEIRPDCVLLLPDT